MALHPSPLPASWAVGSSSSSLGRRRGRPRQWQTVWRCPMAGTPGTAGAAAPAGMLSLMRPALLLQRTLRLRTTGGLRVRQGLLLMAVAVCCQMHATECVYFPLTVSAPQPWLPFAAHARSTSWTALRRAVLPPVITPTSPLLPLLGCCCCCAAGNFRVVHRAAKALGGVPEMLSSKDFAEHGPDERAVILYVAFLCGRLLECSKDDRAAHILQRAWRQSRANTAGARGC